MKDFSEELKRLPEQPGVYIMRNAADVIIYVGKAVSLKNRVRSYFQKGTPKSPKVQAMVDNIDHFEYIVVDTEVEALVLESNFIKEHAPKYNILLRDDKQYPYIKLTNERFPRILKVRSVQNDNATYFGPYPNAYAVNEIIDLLQRVYKIRTCNLNFDRGQSLKRPCLNFYIGTCPAPCVGLADEEAYLQNVKEVEAFLKGRTSEIRAMLTTRMHEASDALRFEQAARYRDDLMHLDALMEKQKVTFTSGKDADIIGMARGVNHVTIQVFFLRGGKVVDREHFTVKREFQESAEEIMGSFLMQFYLDATYVPKEILIETEPEDAGVIRDFLSDKKGQKVNLHVPQRGNKSSLMETVRANAEEQLKKVERREEKKERSQDRGVRELESLLGLEQIHRVEAYDVSNISGVQNVGSMIVYEREAKQPKEYRKFKIKTVEGPDEYGSQREMLERRFDRALEALEKGEMDAGFGALPSIVMMDGGKGQVNVCLEVLGERNFDIPVIGLVKDDKHRTRGVIYDNREYEVDIRSALYKYLYAVQEEVHRFAINYHRQLRGKDMVKTELDEIKGVGEVRKKALLTEFGSVDKIKKATLEELEQCPGMTRASASAVYAHFQKGEENG